MLDRSWWRIAPHAAAALTLALAAGAGAADLIVRNAQVLTMLDGAEYRRMDLLVRDGRFAEGEPGDDAQVVDLAGAYVIPGLTEMHAHVPVPRLDSPGYREDVLFLWAAHGVTRARGMMGHPSHLELRDALLRHEALGPALTISGPSFSGGSVRDPADAPARVRAQKAAGYDLLKIHPGLSAAAFAAVAEAANAEGIPFAGHVTGAVGLFDSLSAGQQTIDHLDGFVETLVPPERLRDRRPLWFGADLMPHVDAAGTVDLVARLKASGTALVPTETLLENVAGPLSELQARPEYAYLPPNLRRAYSRAVENSQRGAEALGEGTATAFLALRKRLTGAAFRAGVPVLLGSDSPQIFNVPGFSIHRELQSMVASGLTPFEAIAAGSSQAARCLGAADRWGSIAPGRDADFVALREDPLADIANTAAVEAVMLRGRLLRRAEIDAGLADIRARYE